VPDRLSLLETEDAAKYAQVASVAYTKDVQEVRRSTDIKTSQRIC
jgi:hypothetical protein